VINDILTAFNLDHHTTNVKAFGTGLINHTWIVDTGVAQYILQKINHKIFKSPNDITENISAISDYLQEHHPEYTFIAPLADRTGKRMVSHVAGYFRLFPFVKDSVTLDIVNTPGQAYEAAAQFGKFTRVLQHFPAERLKTTLPDFHNLTLRHERFKNALHIGNAQRIDEAKSLIARLESHEDILTTYQAVVHNPLFKKRVTHHDTKISNVLFDRHGRGICVIDLDTVMPGYFFSDLGDMMRTYLAPVNEEEKDFTRIGIRKPFLEAVIRGYHDEMKSTLTDIERRHFFFGGRFLIYMQALRFLTDYLLNDVYYPITYPAQNLVRAGNQIALLARFEDHEAAIEGLVASL